MTTDQYQFFGEDERDEQIVAFMHAQEQDLFLHRLNAGRFRAMLAEQGHTQQFEARLRKLLSDTESRIAEVESTIKATEPQLPPPARGRAALGRIRAQAVQSGRVPPLP